MRTAVTDTSINAFHAHGAQSAHQRQRIVAFIAERGGTWSIGELAHAMNLEKSTISARVNECLKSGELEEKLKRKDRRYGITVRPVGIPAQQFDMFGEAA